MLGSLDDLTKPPVGKTFSVSPENVFGRTGAGGLDIPGEEAVEDVKKIGQYPFLQDQHPSRELGQGWKVRPWFSLEPHKETAIFDREGSGVIRHFWITFFEKPLRQIIIRMYWDNETTPSVEVPLGDLFCNAPGYYGEIQSLAVCVNPAKAQNLYLPMPYRKHGRITLELLNDQPADHIYYTINGTDEPVADDALYFHASFRRSNPLKYGEDFVIADGIRGKGRFAGCYMTWQQNNKGWWGEGEVKMFIDGDKEFPSICGTGTEDYFCGAWCFADRTFNSPYSGYHCGGTAETGRRHALYRFHITDPVWFHSDFKATVQALGWRSEHRFLPLQDDISCVAYWYQTEPHAPLPELPDRNGLEVI